MTTNKQDDREKLRRYEELYAKDAREGLTLKEREEQSALYHDLNSTDAAKESQRKCTIAHLMAQIQAEYEAGRHVPKKLPQDLQDYFINVSSG